MPLLLRKGKRKSRSVCCGFSEVDNVGFEPTTR